MSVLRIPDHQRRDGEGGSGGAIAIGVCDRLLMLQYSVYSVISPEGCASILWKSADKKEAAAEAMGLTAQRLSQLGLVDEVIEEPLGGAHRDPRRDLRAPEVRDLLSTSPRSRSCRRMSCAPSAQAKIASFGVFPKPPSRHGGGLSARDRGALSELSSTRPMLAGDSLAPEPRRSVVALSGGLDSTVLAHRARCAAARGCARLRADPRPSRPASASANVERALRALARQLAVPLDGAAREGQRRARRVARSRGA